MDAKVSMLTEGDVCIELPPGYRFHPTDEEIITHYLSQKVLNCGFSTRAIGEVDMNKCEPWDLPQKAKMGEKEWYFFCLKDRKYTTGFRTNRATEAGYWKATGKDKEIYSKGCQQQLVGMKKTLVFYRGRAPKGEKTNWVMHEYKLQGKLSYYHVNLLPAAAAKDEWVVCKVFHKNRGCKRGPIIPSTSSLLRMNSFSLVDDLLFDYSPSLADLLNSPYFNYNDRADGKNVSAATTGGHHVHLDQQHHRYKVSISQDTAGLGTDISSSVISTFGSNENIDGISSGTAPVEDLIDCLWNY